MKTTAMVVTEYGENARFEKQSVELPALKSNQVLIEVCATSMNPVDNKILRGAPIGPELPSALHGDVAGIVKEVGDAVSDFACGDQVFGIAGGVTGHGGASANHMVVNQDLIWHKPKTLSLSDAAALPLVFVTAYEGLVEKARIKAGQKLLVIGGTGGVGHQVVQLGRILGADVTAVVSSAAQAELALSLGATRAINRRETKLEEYLDAGDATGGFDVIFDTVGGPNLDLNWDLVRPNGQVVTTTSMEAHDLTPLHMKGASLHVVFMLLPMLTHSDQKRHQGILKFLAEKVDSSDIRPLLEKQRFTFEQINEAHAYYEKGGHLGKIVLENLNNLA